MTRTRVLALGISTVTCVTPTEQKDWLLQYHVFLRPDGAMAPSADTGQMAGPSSNAAPRSWLPGVGYRAFEEWLGYSPLP